MIPAPLPRGAASPGDAPRVSAPAAPDPPAPASPAAASPGTGAPASDAFSLRVLLVIDATAGPGDPAPGNEGALLLARAALGLPGVDWRVWLLGPPAAASRFDQVTRAPVGWASHLGLHLDGHATTTLGRPESARRSLWKLARALTDQAWAPDAVLATSVPAAEAALSALRGRLGVPTVVLTDRSPEDPPRDILGRSWIDRAPPGLILAAVGKGVADRWSARVITASPGKASLALGHFGATIGLAPPPFNAHPTLQPATAAEDARALNALAHHQAVREATRRHLGIGDDEVAILQLADPRRMGDGRLLGHLTGMLCVAGTSAVGLAPADASLQRGARYLERCERAFDIIRFEGPTAAAALAADLALWDPHCSGTRLRPYRSGVALAAAVASTGLPIIAAPSEPAVGLLGEDAPGLASSGGLNHLGTALWRLANDTHARADAARCQVARLADPAVAWTFHEQLLRLLTGLVVDARRGREWWKIASTTALG